MESAEAGRGLGVGLGLGVGVGRGVTIGVTVGVRTGGWTNGWCGSRCPTWAVIESHVRAQRTILSARCRYVERANVPINGRPSIH